MPTTATVPVASTSVVLPEVQALRAIAVLGVIAYHLWPGVVRGGFAGVDVFFVISGYLITAHLLREQLAGRLGLSRFYARRIRRLLPAALLVLAVATIGTLALLSIGRWPQVLREIIASTVYAENWVLAADSLDYFALNNAASPVQHYWSLSVEEQFYLVWPLLLILGSAIGARLTARRGAIASVLGLVLVASLASSIVLGVTRPAPAYFGTHTRAWEFAAGGLLAVFLVRTAARPVLRSALSWIGLAMVAAALLLYNGSIPFPGVAAVLPVAGTLLVIAAGNPRSRLAPWRLLSLRPVQVVGDLSYGIYLWHWPLLVFVPVLLYGTPNIVVKSLVVVATIVLAALTKRFVEDPLRTGPLLAARRSRVTLASGAAAMAIVAAVALVPLTAVPGILESRESANLTAVEAAGQCLGAAVIDNPDCDSLQPGTFLLPDVDTAALDDVNTLDCWSLSGHRELVSCTHGPTTGAALRVALVGDSHSNQYVSAFTQIAAAHNWRVDVYGKTGCRWSSAEQEETVEWVADCEAWKDALNARLTTGEPYDIVITSSAMKSPIREAAGKTGQQTSIDGFVDSWAAVTQRGTQVIAIRDNPQTTEDYLACIAHNLDDPGAACARPQAESFDGFDAQLEAVPLVEGAHLVDLTQYFCQNGSCPPVIGNVIVYRDPSHLTSTYARTLAPMLHDEILRLTGLSD